MSVDVRQAPPLRYRDLSPVRAAPRPLAFFFLEQLLAARQESRLPTNLLGPDEDVNVYLAGLLARSAAGWTPATPSPGAWVGLVPRRAGTRADRAEHLRANGDVRLLHLGLFDGGDGLRRRRVPWGWTATAARDRDVQIMSDCYATAADLLGRRPAPGAGPADTLRKLAAHADDYVHVLQVLARRRLGLGARLAPAALAALLAPPPDDTADAVRDLMRPRPDAGAWDVLLDLAGAWRRRPTPELRRRLDALAAAVGVDPARLTADRRTAPPIKGGAAGS